MSDTMQITQQVPKSAVAKYVNDAMEMEINSYSLKQTAKNLRQEAKNLECTAQQPNVPSENELNKYQNEYNKIIAQTKQYGTYSEYAKHFVNKKPWKHIIYWFLLICFVDLFGMAATRNILIDYLPLFVLILVICIVSTIFYIRDNNKPKQEYAKFTQDQKNKANNLKNKVDEYQKIYDNELSQKHSQYLQRVDELTNHAAHLEKSAAEIDGVLQKHYSVGIIPPDYRDILRVMYINRAFRNDQVDTMREATLLCDRDIYHLEIKEGLHEIASAVSCLASSIDSIGHRISEMSNEITKLSYNMEMVASETRSARYANESVAHAQEQLLWYEQQKWYRDTYK